MTKEEFLVQLEKFKIAVIEDCAIQEIDSYSFLVGYEGVWANSHGDEINLFLNILRKKYLISERGIEFIMFILKMEMMEGESE